MEHLPQPLKFLFIGTAALLTTAACFFFMQMLIATSLERAPDIPAPEFSAPIFREADISEEREVRTRASRMMPAELPPHPEGISIAPEDVVVLVHAPRPSFGSIAEVVDHEATDFELLPPLSDLVPLYVVQPVYPFKAVMRQNEGFVVVNFSVRENGNQASVKHFRRL